jgi:hypothetical protein
MKHLAFLLTIAVFLALGHQAIFAQSEAPKVEVGVQYSVLRLKGVGLVLNGSTDQGVGGRVTYNVTNTFSLEGEVDYFGKKLKDLRDGGDRTLGIFGIKYGMRSERAGIFGKLRPGLMHFSSPLAPSNVVSACSLGRKDHFALDAGAVMEFYPIRHAVVRFDFGDTIVRVSDIRCPFLTNSAVTTHNAMFTAGIGFRF